MKKNISSLAALSAIVLATSCTNNANVQVVTSADSLAYAAGVVNTDGLFEHVTTRMGIDPEYMPQVIEGIKEAFASVQVSDTGWENCHHRCPDSQRSIPWCLSPRCVCAKCLFLH